MNLSLTGKTAVIMRGIPGLRAALPPGNWPCWAPPASCWPRNEQNMPHGRRSLAGYFPGAAAQLLSSQTSTKPEKATGYDQRHYQRSRSCNILVNNTGGPSGGPILAAEGGASCEAFEMHVVCNQILAQAVVPGMKANGYGRIIQMISTSVKTPLKSLGVSNTIRAPWPTGRSRWPVSWRLSALRSTMCCPAP